MALSPADFYAYSRATGAPVPEDPEERARIAPDVLEYRRNQLKAPQQEENRPIDPLSIGIGLGLAAAGGIGGFMATKRLLKGPARSVTAPVRPVNLDEIVERRPVAERIRKEYTPKETTPSVVEPSRVVEQQQTQIPDPWSGQEKVPPKSFARQFLEDEGSLAPVVEKREQPSGQFTELPTKANQPGTFSDLTSIQESLLNQARNQTVNAVEAGEDQVVQRINAKSALRAHAPGSKFAAQAAQTSAQVQALMDAGIDDFELKARLNQYASTGKSEFLSLDFNPSVVGKENFARALGVVEPQFVSTQNLPGGGLIGGTLINPEGEIRISAFAKTQPTIRTVSASGGEENWEPISEALTGLVGGVSTATVPYKQSEQYEQAINNFRQHWDTELQKHLSGEGSNITRPARQERLVDAFDLDMPVRLQNVEELNDAGELVTKKEKVLYRDILPQDVVQDIEQGRQRVLPVPFLVNKERALAVAKADPSIENRMEAAAWKETGRALANAYEAIVAPLENSRYIADVAEGRFFIPGEPDLIPAKGRGSEKGKLVGGIKEERLPEPIYPLVFGQKSIGEGSSARTINVVHFPTESGTYEISNWQQFENRVPQLLDTEGNPQVVSPAQQRDYIMTQPMAIRKAKRVSAGTDEQGNPVQKMVEMFNKKGEKYEAPLVRFQNEIVSAPLQVLNAKTGKTISNFGQLNRESFTSLVNLVRNKLPEYDQHNYTVIAEKLDQVLQETQGVKLPVLSSDTAFNFIEDVLGRPKSRATQVRYGTLGSEGQIFPMKDEDAVRLGIAIKVPGKNPSAGRQDPSLSRSEVGAPTLNIAQSAKTEQQWEQTGWNPEDWQETREYGEEGLGIARGEQVELGSARRPGLLQRQMTPATTGPGAEMQSLRQRLATIKPPEVATSNEPLPSNLEVVTQQLMAQAGRRAGKRRNR